MIKASVEKFSSAENPRTKLQQNVNDMVNVLPKVMLFVQLCLKVLLYCLQYIPDPVEGLYYTRVSVPFTELAPPPPLPQASVSHPPGAKEGGKHSLGGKREGGKPILTT
jgi:hypothetical protein